MAYDLAILRSAERQLADLPPAVRDELIAAISALAEDPRPTPPLGRKLRGEPPRYRLRWREYRVVYRVDDGSRLVTVTWAGHRRDAYRRS